MAGGGFGTPETPAPKKKKAAKKKAAVPSALAIDRAKAAMTKQKAADPVLGEGSRRSQKRQDARRVDVELGKGKAVAVMLPRLDGEVDDADVAHMSMEAVAEKYGHLTGAGDIVWPAGLAFSRLLAHCPSFVEGKRVLELGTGIGAVGLVAATSGAASVLLTDYDEAVLEFAREGATENGVSDSVTAARLDWSKSDLPEGAPFDVVLAADVLYAETNAMHIAKLLPELLSPSGRCFIADQAQWPWRADFQAACAQGGLLVEDMKLPGPEDVRLLTVGRAADLS